MNKIKFETITLHNTRRDEHLYLGPDPETLLDYRNHPSNYTCELYKSAFVTSVMPENIAGIYLSDYDIQHPDVFWSMHHENGTFETFRAIAKKIPEAREYVLSGKNVYDLPRDSELRTCILTYFIPRLGIPVLQFENFMYFQDSGRHRIIAAMGLGEPIPVTVIGRAEPISGKARQKELYTSVKRSIGLTHEQLKAMRNPFENPEHAGSHFAPSFEL